MTDAVLTRAPIGRGTGGPRRSVNVLPLACPWASDALYGLVLGLPKTVRRVMVARNGAEPQLLGDVRPLVRPGDRLEVWGYDCNGAVLIGVVAQVPAQRAQDLVVLDRVLA